MNAAKRRVRGVGLLGALGLCLLSSMATADNCDHAATDVVSSVRSVRFVRRSPMGTSIFLAHPLAEEISLSCNSDPLRISIAWRDGYPSMAFFDMAAAAARIVSGVAEAQIRRHLVACHRGAVASSSGLEKSYDGDIWVECHAFAAGPRGGGSLFTIHANKAPSAPR